MSVAGWIKDRLGIISPSITVRDAYREVALTAMDALGEEQEGIADVLHSTLSGEVVPGVSLVISSDGPVHWVSLLITEPRVYAYGIMWVHLLGRTGFMRVKVDSDIVLEVRPHWVEWIERGGLPFVADTDELRELCVDIRNSAALIDLAGKIHGFVYGE